MMYSTRLHRLAKIKLLEKNGIIPHITNRKESRLTVPVLRLGAKKQGQTEANVALQEPPWPLTNPPRALIISSAVDPHNGNPELDLKARDLGQQFLLKGLCFQKTRVTEKVLKLQCQESVPLLLLSSSSEGHTCVKLIIFSRTQVCGSVITCECECM